MVQTSKVYPGRGVDSYALSPMQQGMLFHSLEPGARGVDVEQVVCVVDGEISAAAFEKAWRDVVARHPIFRTSFHWAHGEAPRQVVHAPTDARLVFRSAEFGSEAEAERGVQEYLEPDRAEGFDVAVAPLLRIALFRGGAGKSWFVTTFHHLLLDGRAMVVMFREAFELHDAYVAGQTLTLPPPRPYRAYIDWLQQQDPTRAERFWRGQLKGFTAPTSLPIARAASEGVTEITDHRGELAIQLPASCATRLRAVARRHDVTMNTLLQAAWANILSRYTGEDDVVFGAVRACRHIPVEGAGSIVGLMINTVPVRVRVNPAASLETWLQELREQWLALRDHEHTPLVEIQRWSEVAPGRPLFDTLFNYQEPSWDAALRALGGPWLHRHFDIVSQPNYPLAIDAYGGATIIVKALFDRRRYADAAIARLLGHYRTILEAFAAESVRVVGELPLLTDAERRRVLVEWNCTAMDFPREVGVSALVEAQAKKNPQRLAVADAITALTYGELNRRANQLAHRLVALGVKADTPVAVCMKRAAEMLVAWLGVLKAGGAFVPLDPDYPPERLAFQLGDCGATVLLTQATVRPSLPEMPPSVTVLELRPDGSGFETESNANLPPRAAPENLAYIIYTSGSTGQPKGVMIEHTSLMNLVTWHQREYAVTRDDRATQLASPAFDAAVWETWPYLAAGASVHLPSEETRISPAELVRWLAAEQITITFLPTPLAEAVLNESWPATTVLRAVLTGGDKLKQRPPINFPCALINHYGPTESTVVATSGRVKPAGEGDATPTIGRPIANTQAMVLDALLRPLPVGVPGELCLGGLGLARGYWERAALNVEKFIAAPSRLYRTGDLVRWREDGEIEYLGRIDGQVKVRGCRIELGEIETTLQRHAAARQSIVIVRPDAQGQAQLVAYMLRDATAPVSAAELAAFLRENLPAYMVPAAFVFVDAWPLTPNGKIDRKALPAPEQLAPDADTTPRTRTERVVAKAWADVLGRTAVGAQDNFFESGGHSLLAAQVISRVNHALGTNLSVRCLFDHATVAALARAIDERAAGAAPARTPLQRLKRRAERPEMELVPPN